MANKTPTMAMTKKTMPKTTKMAGHPMLPSCNGNGTKKGGK